MTFSERLVFLQKERHLTKTDIQKALGLSRATYFRYEHGERFPTYENLLQFADFFNVSLDYLAGRTDNPKVNH